MTFLPDSSVGNSLRFFDGFSDHAVQRLDSISRINRFPNVLRVVKQRIAILPMGCPGAADLRVFSVPFISELL